MFKLLKKSLIILVATAIGVVVIIRSLTYIEKFKQQYPITKLQVVGQLDYVRITEITNSLQDLLQTNLWSVNLNLVKQRLLANPWINFVVVKKLWPDLLQIELIQHNPIAKWNDKYYLTATGEILQSTKQNSERLSKLNIPKFYGRTEQKSLLIDTYLLLLEKLAVIGLTIVNLSFDPTQGIAVLLSNNINLKLGTFDLPARIARFIIAYKKKLWRNISDISYIDLRYNNGVAVAWLTKDVELE